MTTFTVHEDQAGSRLPASAVRAPMAGPQISPQNGT